jgi:ATP/maltotriose-dependent transcriptional regulator MalT
VRCPSCGEEVPERFRLCGYCGTELAPAPPPQQVRKTVSVVFCDLVGSTSLGERVDSESLREVLNRDFAASYGALEAMGDRAYLATVAALRAQVAADADRPDDAERYSRVSEEAASPDDVETQALRRAARAKALAHGGRLDVAEALAREAVALVEPTEQPALQGGMLLDLARVLAAAGRDREAAETATRAAGRFALKGDVVERARALALAAGRPALA